MSEITLGQIVKEELIGLVKNHKILVAWGVFTTLWGIGQMVSGGNALAGLWAVIAVFAHFLIAMQEDDIKRLRDERNERND